MKRTIKSKYGDTCYTISCGVYLYEMNFKMPKKTIPDYQKKDLMKLVCSLQKPDNLTTFRRSKLTTSELVL